MQRTNKLKHSILFASTYIYVGCNIIGEKKMNIFETINGFFFVNDNCCLKKKLSEKQQFSFTSSTKCHPTVIFYEMLKFLQEKTAKFGRLLNYYIFGYRIFVPKSTTLLFSSIVLVTICTLFYNRIYCFVLHLDQFT